MSKDPVLRTAVIVILGIILFQMLFNLITGNGSMEDMGSNTMITNSTSSIDNLLTGLMALLIKLLIIVLLVSIIISIFMWMKKNFFPNIKVTQFVKNNPMYQSLIGIITAVAGLFLLIYIYDFISYPNTNHMNEMNVSMSSNGNSAGGFSGSLGVTGLITFLLKILIYVFLISLIISLIAFLKKQIETGDIHLFQNFNFMKTTWNNTDKDKMEPDTDKDDQDPVMNSNE